MQGAGGFGGGNRNAYQHPSAISVTGGSNDKLALTLDVPARAGDTVTLSYKLMTNHVGLLQDTERQHGAGVRRPGGDQQHGRARLGPRRCTRVGEGDGAAV